MNYIYWLEIHISEGLRFPLPLLVHQFLHFTKIYLVYVHMNLIRVLLKVSVLNKKPCLNIGLEEVLYITSLSDGSSGDIISFLMPNRSNWLPICRIPAKTSLKVVLLFGDECKTHLCFEFISQAILSILYPYSCKTDNISSKFGFARFFMESK